MPINGWKLTINVTQDEYIAVVGLARKCRTSPSAVAQYAVRKMLADAENALPLIPAASDMPENSKRDLSLYASYGPKDQKLATAKPSLDARRYTFLQVVRSKTPPTLQDGETL